MEPPTQTFLKITKWSPWLFRLHFQSPKLSKITFSPLNLWKITFQPQIFPNHILAPSFQNYIFTPKVLKNAQRLLRSQKYILTVILCQIKMFSFKNNNLSTDIILIFYKHLTFVLLVFSLYLFAWEIFWENEWKINFVRLYMLWSEASHI